MDRWFGPLVGMGIVAAAGVAFVRLVFVHEAVRRRLFPVLRPLYKKVFNPKALRDAERGETRWSIIHHVGRRSGVTYATPIDAQPTPDGVVICLVYGPGADWSRNVLAAGHCTLTHNGEELAMTAPGVISMSDAEPMLSPDRARFWRGIGIEHCLSLHHAPPTNSTAAPDAGSVLESPNVVIS